MADPWLSVQQRRDATYVELDTALSAGYQAAVAEVLAKLWRIVLGERNAVTAASTAPDFSGAENAARETWNQALARWVKPIAYAYYRRQYAEQPGDGQARTTDIDNWWNAALGRMQPTPDNMVEALRAEIRSRPRDSVDALRDAVALALGLDTGTREVRARLAAVEERLRRPDSDELYARRVSLQAELFRVQASRLRSNAYMELADADPDNAENYRELARQSRRGQADEDRIQRLLRQTEEQLFNGSELEITSSERAELRSKRRELYSELADSEDTWRNTATRLARTLSTDVLNDATLQRAEDVEREQGVELVKVWISAKDSRTRPTHRAANGQVVGLREKFRIGDDQLDRPGDPEGSLDETIQCRCTVTYLTRAEHDEIASVLASGGWCAPTNYELPGDIEYAPIVIPDTMTAAGETVTQTPLESLPPLMWHGVIAKEGVYTGDRRKFQPGALRTQAFPFPMRFQREDWGGHQGAVVTANAEAARRYQGDVRAWGTFADGSLTPEVEEVIGLMANRMMRGVSIDGDDVLDSQFQVEIDEQGNVYEAFDSMRLRAATFVAIPAFDGAEIYLGPPPPEWLLEGEALAEEQNEAETRPIDLDDLLAAAGRLAESQAEFWLPGAEGGDRIDWSSDGAYSRCRTALGEYVTAGQASSACANLHYQALGVWPGEQTGGYVSSPALVASADSQFTIGDFARLELDGPTALTVDETGKVYGHIAAWGTCHTGYSDMCVLPPKSKTDYSLFHTGAVRLADGNDLPVGKLTVGAGHANGRSGVRAATEHYDNSAMAVAIVRAYEDAFGIQVVGQIIPGTPEDKIAELRRSPISGDWRAYQGNLELIAALGVNTPGFPVPRTMVASVGGVQTALVAAGIVWTAEDDAAVEAEVAQLASKIGLDPKSIAAQLAARIPALGGQ